VHLHDEIPGLPPQLVALSRFVVQTDGGETVKEERNDCQTVRPAEIIKIGVHQPVASDVGTAEDSHGQKHENS
jgi:hypothetical protein